MVAVTVEAEKELKKLREQVRELKAAVSSSDQRNVAFSHDLGAARKQIEGLQKVAAENAELKKALANRDRELATANASLNSVSAQADKAKAVLTAAREIRTILDRVL